MRILHLLETFFLNKHLPSILNKALKDLFEVNHDGRLYIKEDVHGNLVAMAGFELEA